MNPKYHVNIFWSEEDGCWIGNAPDLPGCTAHGDTREQALAELETAMRGWLDSASAHGLPIPAASPARSAA